MGHCIIIIIYVDCEQDETLATTVPSYITETLIEIPFIECILSLQITHNPRQGVTIGDGLNTNQKIN